MSDFPSDSQPTGEYQESPIEPADSADDPFHYNSNQLQAAARVAGGTAHDLNNVMTVIGGNLRLLRMDIDDSELSEDCADTINDCLAALEQGQALTRGMLAISQVEESLQVDLDTSVDVIRTLTDTMALCRRILPDAIKVKADYPGKYVFAIGEYSALKHCLINLVLNARNALPGGGEIVFSVQQASNPTHHCDSQLPGNFWAISVSDDGSGMPEEHRRRAARPLFSTKSLGKGAGLGLYMVDRYVRSCGGSLTIESLQGTGTRVTLLLPAVNDQSVSGAAKR